MRRSAILARQAPFPPCPLRARSRGERRGITVAHGHTYMAADLAPGRSDRRHRRTPKQSVTRTGAEDHRPPRRLRDGKVFKIRTTLADAVDCLSEEPQANFATELDTRTGPVSEESQYRPALSQMRVSTRRTVHICIPGGSPILCSTFLVSPGGTSPIVARLAESFNEIAPCERTGIVFGAYAKTTIARSIVAGRLLSFRAKTVSVLSTGS